MTDRPKLTIKTKTSSPTVLEALGPDVHQRLEDIAKRSGHSVPQFIKIISHQWLENRRKKAEGKAARKALNDERQAAAAARKAQKQGVTASPPENGSTGL